MHEELDTKGRSFDLSEEQLAVSDTDTNSEGNAENFERSTNAWTDLRPRGVGGWLLFFIVTLVFIRPLALSASILQFNSAWKFLYADYPFIEAVNVINLIVGFGLSCFSVYAGIRLWKVRPNAVHIAKTYLILSTISTIILTCLPLVAGLPEEATIAMLRLLPVEILKMLVYPAVWFLYLTQSKRVAATYANVI